MAPVTPFFRADSGAASAATVTKDDKPRSLCRGVPCGKAYRWPRSEVFVACSGGGIREWGSLGGGDGREKATSWVSRTLETGVLLVGLSRDGGGGDRMETQCGAVSLESCRGVSVRS